MSDSDLAALLRRSPLFDALPEAATAELESGIARRRYGGDHLLFAEGDPGSELLIIARGGVKIFRFADGAEVVVALLGPGEFFGEMALLDDDQPRGASAVTLGDTVLLALQREDFLEALRNTPDAVLHVLRVLSGRLRAAGARLAECACLDIRERLAKVLSELAEREGEETDRGVRIPGTLSEADLAQRAGGTVERVRSEMARLQRELILSVSEDAITVWKPDDLRDLAAGSGGAPGSITLPDWLLG